MTKENKNNEKRLLDVSLQQPKSKNSKSRILTRGRTFEGFVIRRFPNRITIEFERTTYIPKFERFLKKKTRLHARIPQDMELELGDLVHVEECRPLSKTIHFIATKKIYSSKNGDKK